MLKSALAFFLFLLAANLLQAQDTIRIQRPEDDRYCSLQLCIKKECFTDSIPLSVLSGDINMELTINDRCDTKKHADVFVTSFEVWTDDKQAITAHSSFFTGMQKKKILGLSKGEAFTIKNVVVHAPDGFTKFDSLRVIIK
ncbi:MAG: hypothetical protein JWO44_2462 [Bacteroidetes bacterium]|jgi:hypothetical protein|nr:hypothetical protein [Bacteroidota bacterium]